MLKNKVPLPFLLLAFYWLENLNSASSSSKFLLGKAFFWNYDLILCMCFWILSSSAHVPFTPNGWLYTMGHLVSSESVEVWCKFWCLPCTFNVKVSINYPFWQLNTRNGKLSLLDSWLNFKLGSKLLRSSKNNFSSSCEQRKIY